MKTSYRILFPDGKETSGEVNWPEEPGYDRIAALVRPLLGPGRHLEHLYVFRPDTVVPEKIQEEDIRDMFVDDCGLMDELPVNEAATRIYWAHFLRGGAYVIRLNKIHGLAVLFDRRVWF